MQDRPPNSAPPPPNPGAPPATDPASTTAAPPCTPRRNSWRLLSIASTQTRSNPGFDSIEPPCFGPASVTWRGPWYLGFVWVRSREDDQGWWCLVAADESTIGSGKTVAEVMLGSPKALPADCSVETVRQLFANPKVRMALLVDEGKIFRGALTRSDLEAAASPDESALRYAQPGSPISPHARADEVFEQMTRSRTRRLVVLDEDGETLVGLV